MHRFKLLGIAFLPNTDEHMQPYPDARELVWASRMEQRNERPA